MTVNCGNIISLSRFADRPDQGVGRTSIGGDDGRAETSLEAVRRLAGLVLFTNETKVTGEINRTTGCQCMIIEQEKRFHRRERGREIAIGEGAKLGQSNRQYRRLPDDVCLFIVSGSTRAVDFGG
jgi:hypothetical protein